MRTDKISIQQSKQIVIKYFTSNYDFNQLFLLFKDKRSKKQIVQSLKQSIKDILIQLQGQLFSSKQIQSLKIYDHINTTHIMDYIINLQEILTAQTAADLLTYYKYKSQFFIITRFHVIEVPVDPITSKKKLAVYECFLQYFQQKGLFQTVIQYQDPQQLPIHSQQNNFQTNSFVQLYSQQQTQYIFKLFQALNGQLQPIVNQLQQKGFPNQKSSKNNIKKLLINYLTIGLGRIYKLSNNLDKFSGCSWNKFKQVHKRLMQSFTLEQKILVLRMGIYNNIQDRDIMLICDKIGIRYRPVGYPKWTKDTSGCKLYRKDKITVMEKIRNQMRNIVQAEIYKGQKKQ